MRKPLSANFFSMVHTKRFWLGAIFMAGFAGIEIWSRHRLVSQGFADATIDECILSFAPLLFVLLPIVCGLFINTDYHDGTIRNKITVGQSRSSVYIANLLIVWLVEIFYTAVHLAVVLIGGIGLKFNNPVDTLLKGGLLLLTIAAIAAIASFIATIMTGRYALVLCALLALGLMFGSQMMSDMLANPDMTPDYEQVLMVTDDDGNMQYEYYDHAGNKYTDPDDLPMVPNPGYVSEPLRTIMRKYNDVSPGGQLWEIIRGGHVEWDIEKQERVELAAPAWELALYSVLLIAGFTLLGLMIFKRKDLK